MVEKDTQSARGQLKKQSPMRARRSSSDDDNMGSDFCAFPWSTHPAFNVEDRGIEERQISCRLVRSTRVQNGMFRGVRV